MELLLKCLYRTELSQEARSDGVLLLRVYRLEDMYKIPAACMEPISAALSAFQAAKDINLALLSHVYGLPAQLLEAPPLQKIAAACKLKLVEIFGDIPSVITNLEQRQKFCALPHVAVLDWLQSDNLKVHSESCVLLLLSAWVDSMEPPECSPDELTQLAHGIRVECLSATYLHSVLPDLKWFQEGCSDKLGFLRGMLLQKAIGGPHIEWEGPAAWIAGKRRGTAMPRSVTLAWDLGPEELGPLNTAAAEESGRFSPGSAYLNGVFYKVLVDREEQEESEEE